MYRPNAIEIGQIYLTYVQYFSINYTNIFRPIVVVFKTLKDRQIVFAEQYQLKRKGKYAITECSKPLCIF